MKLTWWYDLAAWLNSWRPQPCPHCHARAWWRYVRETESLGRCLELHCSRCGEVRTLWLQDEYGSWYSDREWRRALGV